MSAVLLVLLAALALPIGLSLRIVPEAQRLVVFRLGRLYSVLTPGLHCILPGLDRVVRVDLNAAVPDWRSLGEPDLDARLRELAQSGQLARVIS